MAFAPSCVNIKNRPLYVHVLADFDETRAVEWFMALDYGYAHYTVCLLACRDGDGNVFVVDEHAARMWLPQRHCGAILAMLTRHGLTDRDIRRFVAGTDVFSRQSDGQTIAGQYKRHGVLLSAANMDRINGWAEVRQAFGEPQCGLLSGSAPAEGNTQADAVRPKLFIHERCRRLIETLPILQHDPSRSEDVLKVDADEDGVGGDDAADCLRYLLATKARSVQVRKLSGL